MAVHVLLQRAGKTAAHRIAFLLVGVLILGGCTSGPPALLVRAVAAGAPSLAPFFEEDSGLGEDADIASEPPHSGLQQGNTPGLYGGSRKPSVCDVDRLKDFLTDPKNKQKAREWARVIGIDRATTDRIEEYLDALTPVLLRHDTLVVNHDYKKGRAAPFEALLQAGIAVLVDIEGMPVVKCSCGNPLTAFDKDADDITVEFEDGNAKWDGYDESAAVAVEPAPRPIDDLKLIDVDNPSQGLSRPVGSTGGSDTSFDATAAHEVPDVTGMAFDAAGQELARLGLAVVVTGDGLPPGDARVTGTDPQPGTALEFGSAVTLSVDEEEEGTGTGSTGDGGGGVTPGAPSDEATTEGPTDGTTTGAPPPEESTGQAPPPEESTSAAPPPEQSTGAAPPPEQSTTQSSPAEQTTSAAPPPEQSGSVVPPSDGVVVSAAAAGR
ncbi:DUF6777 domain-containing protein [Streptomyces sp. CRN 30]|uniref:DUF6777 domain-containing protein n=1 Tax=Streptomyces sp. CRN 30 TaxID=3075613 RepID=UPI002A83ED25|nr:DUF6777 domain-containing protein [Streptomyces sp. CRN 30]